MRLEQAPNQARVIVVQQGARHNYAMPAAFADRGMLEALYTDLCHGRGLGRLTGLAAHLPGAPRSAARLANRRPPANVLDRTRTFDAVGLKLHRSMAVRDEATTRRREDLIRRAGDQMRRVGLGRATHVLSMFGEGRSFLEHAQRSGLKVVCDVNVALSSERIVREEQQRFPDWEEPIFYWGETLRTADGAFDPTGPMLRYSDRLLCPSEFVRDDLIENFGVAADRTWLLPYSVDPRWLELETRPEPGRILFVGTAELRKGVHYLAAAATLLRGRSSTYQIRVAGGVTERIRGQPTARDLTFLGRVPRAQVAEEFAKADVLALPSLAEGSAGVTYEALGAGIPVVTTKASGSVVRDGVEGFVVPERDPEALVGAIARIVSDRALRMRMSQAARERAREFVWDRFSERLVEAVVTA
jgi:glycosyltransferase involved in cell wall biosynthesis